MKNEFIFITALYTAMWALVLIFAILFIGYINTGPVGYLVIMGLLVVFIIWIPMRVLESDWFKEIYGGLER